MADTPKIAIAGVRVHRYRYRSSRLPRLLVSEKASWLRVRFGLSTLAIEYHSGW
ncbi:hypothetical protein F4695_004575 [Rhizobium soli]|uniref:Uncharacterized protein n=1 Tax=Rhizobium soli TaxID=424798 RepID=A0A7X0JQT1_9HYPH|nr:hypothetical protein [Rhizobium soli]